MIVDTLIKHNNNAKMHALMRKDIGKVVPITDPLLRVANVLISAPARFEAKREGARYVFEAGANSMGISQWERLVSELHMCTKKPEIRIDSKNGDIRTISVPLNGSSDRLVFNDTLVEAIRNASDFCSCSVYVHLDGNFDARYYLQPINSGA